MLIAVIATGMTSCGGGISGSVMGSRQSCSSNLDGGRCQGGFKKLSGTISEDMSTARTGFSQVTAEVWASVEEGAVKVYLVDPDGIETSQIARPGKPVEISGGPEAYYDSFRVYFEALDGEALGIEYIVDYTYP